MDMSKENPKVAENGIDKEFRKQVFFKIKNLEGSYLIHYMGNEKAYVSKSHENSSIWYGW